MTAQIWLIEAETLMYACRWSGNEAHLFHAKSCLQVAGGEAADLDQLDALLGERLPICIVPTTILETSLGNIGLLFHPLPTLWRCRRHHRKHRGALSE